MEYGTGIVNGKRGKMENGTWNMGYLILRTKYMDSGKPNGTWIMDGGRWNMDFEHGPRGSQPANLGSGWMEHTYTQAENMVSGT